MVTEVAKCDFNQILKKQKPYQPVERLSVKIFFNELATVFGAKFKSAYGEIPKPNSSLYKLVVDYLVLPPIDETAESKQAAAQYLRDAVIAYKMDCDGWPDVGDAVKFVNAFIPDGEIDISIAFKEAQSKLNRAGHSFGAPKWSSVIVREAAIKTGTHNLYSGDQKLALREFKKNLSKAIRMFKNGELVEPDYEKPALPETVNTVSPEEARAKLSKVRESLCGKTRNTSEQNGSISS